MLLNAQTGIPVASMSNCDSEAATFMSTYNLTGMSIAIAKNGRLIYHRGFGNADINGGEPTQPHHLFRIASISKPVTSIAIMNMVEQNQLALTDKVFGAGGLLENHSVISNATITDARIYDITVQNLLEHTAGWDRGVNCFPTPTPPYPYFFSGCDPISAPLHVTQTNGTLNPAKEEDMIVFLLEKGLNFSPNTDYQYSNIGYLVLGEIIEEISGLSYEDYVKAALLSQIGNCDMHIGKNLLEDKAEREAEYVGTGSTMLSCYNTGSVVPREYGGLNIEAMDAHGGWIASSRDLVNLLVAVDGFSSKPDILSASTITSMTTPSANNNYYAKGWSVNPSNNWWHNGALPGTATFFARTNSQYTWAVLLNNRIYGANSTQFWTDLDGLPWACIGGASSFPAHDLLDLPMSNSTSIQFPTVGTDSVSVSWSNGSGDQRIVVAKQNGSVEDFPLDGQTYTGSATFGLGDDLGDNTYVVYNGTGNSVDVGGLSANTSYTFRVFDYNQSSNTGNHALYRLCGGDEQAVTTISAVSVDPIAQADELKLYPTLATEKIHLEFDYFVEGGSYEIFTVTGALYNKGSFEGKKHSININGLENGLYLINVKTAKGDLIGKKFIKI